MKDLTLICELLPSTTASVKEKQLGTVRRCSIEISNDDDHADDSGGDPHELVMDETRARELFNWLGAWLHRA